MYNEMCNPYFNDLNVYQVHTSSALLFFEKKILRYYGLTKYHDKKQPALFFGVYTRDDLIAIRDHFCAKHVLWGGTDADVKYKPGNKKYVFEKLKEFGNINHYSSSKDLYNRLLDIGFVNTRLFIDFSEYDPQFSEKLTEFGDCVYIYNGLSDGQAEKYGKEVYEEVVRRLPYVKFIYSNDLRVPSDKVIDVYRRCFIGLRLTEHDACAQTVLEMRRIGLPVVHNGDYDNCLGWKTAEDVIEHIVGKYFLVK